MPQLENKEILDRLLRTTIEVVGRRTSEAYANVIIGNAIKDLTITYSFLRYVKIKGTQYDEDYDLVKINDDVNQVKTEEVSQAANHFMHRITKLMGRNAGYYFIKEIKEDLPFEYEQTIRNLGINLDILQLEFLTEMKETFKYQIQCSEVFRYVLTLCFEILDKEIGRDHSYKLLSELVQRLSTEYEVLKYVKVNDILAIVGVDVVVVDPNMDLVEPTRVGVAIQKVVQEINNSLDTRDTRSNFSFIDKIKSNVTHEYDFKLEELGVNLDIIKLSNKLVIKNVIKALIDVISDSTTESYATLLVDNMIKKINEKYGFLRFVLIDSSKYSKGFDAVSVLSDIDSASPSELGRSIQRLIESLSVSLGEEAGGNFIEKFKKRLGKAYVLRIEEIGVNLHMIELKQNLTW